MGPTAVGKTDLAFLWAETLPCEIISIDSAMIYRGMDIGTAKPSLLERERVPHHLIDILDPTESYSVAQCCDDVLQLCRAIHQRGNLPLLVGGSMMYFRALQQGLSVLPHANAVLRAQLLEEAQQVGWGVMHQRLAKVDPVSASRIHPSDTQRLQRALEVFQQTGTPLSVLQQETAYHHEIQWLNILLLPETRAWLHDRIAVRFQQMLKEGFLDEVSMLLQQWPLTMAHPSLRCVGYRQAFDYLQGQIDYTLFCEKGVAATRQLAKRQLTWLRHWPSGHVVSTHEKPDVEMIKTLLERGYGLQQP